MVCAEHDHLPARRRAGGLLSFARDVAGGARLVVTAKPKASKQGVFVKGDVVVVAVHAVAADGKANDAIVDVVAAFVGVSRSRVRIARGATARHKELVIDGISAADVDARLADARLVDG